MTLAVELPSLPRRSAISRGADFFDYSPDTIANTDLRTLAQHMLHGNGITSEAASTLEERLTTTHKRGHLALFADPEIAERMPPCNELLESELAKLSPEKQVEIGLAVFSRIASIVEVCDRRRMKPTQDMLHGHGIGLRGKPISTSAIHTRNTGTNRVRDGFAPLRLSVNKAEE
jgi:hypothetical protein